MANALESQKVSDLLAAFFSVVDGHFATLFRSRSATAMILVSLSPLGLTDLWSPFFAAAKVASMKASPTSSSPKWTLAAGYRYLFFDYRPGSAGVFNVITSGALIGATYSIK